MASTKSTPKAAAAKQAAPQNARKSTTDPESRHGKRLARYKAALESRTPVPQPKVPVNVKAVQRRPVAKPQDGGPEVMRFEVFWLHGEQEGKSVFRANSRTEALQELWRTFPDYGYTGSRPLPPHGPHGEVDQPLPSECAARGSSENSRASEASNTTTAGGAFRRCWCCKHLNEVPRAAWDSAAPAMACESCSAVIPLDTP